MRTLLLNLYVWAACLVPTRDELRVGLLGGAVVFLAGIAFFPLLALLAALLLGV